MDRGAWWASVWGRTESDTEAAWHVRLRSSPRDCPLEGNFRSAEHTHLQSSPHSKECGSGPEIITLILCSLRIGALPPLQGNLRSGGGVLVSPNRGLLCSKTPCLLQQNWHFQKHSFFSLAHQSCSKDRCY